MKFNLRRNISLKINILMIFMVIALFLIIGIFEFQTSQRESINRLRSDYEIISNRLIETLKNPIWDLDIDTMNNILIAELQNKNIHSIAVIDYQTSKLLAGKTRGVSWEIVELDISVSNLPFERRVEVSRDESPIALIELQLTDRFYKAEINSKIRELIVQTVVLIIVFSLVLSFTILFIVIRPVKKLAKEVESIGQGNLNETITLNRKDELGQLATTFNQMMGSLRESRDKLQHWGEELEKEVRGRTRDLEEKSQELASTNVLLEEASRHKSQFLANMSHELRTPLNSIIGYTKLMLDGLEGDISEEQQRDLQTVHRNSLHLLELINGLLDVSRIEAGKTVLSYETFTISELLDEVVPDMEQLAREKGLTLTHSVDSDGASLHLDKAKTRQVLINILGNAITFTNEGSVRLKVADSESDIIFSVTDTGIGIEEENMEVIFDSFRQVGPTQTAGYAGTGLGLSISKQYIEMQGGKIWAESKLGKGSTFTFSLPKNRVAVS